MTGPLYREFFFRATGNQPFDYQRRLAGDDSGATCQSQIINVPTGLGKTAAVVLAWLWNRVELKKADWPRRLVYCLPMRTLVEQTQESIRAWLKKLGDLEWDKKSPHQGKVGLHILMGGEEREQTPWDIYPEENAILIGTQDMLLSRALNRGYAMSRYRWPMQFGLLNNDSLWLFDEVQLMGNGLATGVQLDAFRTAALWSTTKPCVTWWMSATSSADVFSTTDRTELKLPPPPDFKLTEEERQDEKLGTRLLPEKKIEILPKAPKLTEILARHQPGRLTLVVLNTISSAMQWHSDIQNQLAAQNSKRKSAFATPDTILLHSRFRRVDRRERMKELQDFLELSRATGAAPENHPGLVVVATQVIEAGFDMSAAVLWSEVAPWASVIQRLGRLNRDNRQPNARAGFWMPKQQNEENGKDSPNAGRIGPYEKTALKKSQQLMATVIANMAQGQIYRAALDAVLESEASIEALKFSSPVIVRPDDVYGLFSTEPDLAGGFTNISPFVRTADLSSDVIVYWRTFDGVPQGDYAPPFSEEVVQVPSYLFGQFLMASKQRAFAWNDDDDGSWNSVWHGDVVPGMTLLLPVSAGGYSADRGWTGDSDDKPSVLKPIVASRQSLFSDHESETAWQLLSEHTAAVLAASMWLAGELSFSESWRTALALAAKWHDVGKAHPRWQNTLPPAPDGKTGPWAKFGGNFRKIPEVRHEAFSLLAAWEQTRTIASEISALALYLIASHHGKVRTVLRSSQRGNNLFGWRNDDDPLVLNGKAYQVDLSVRQFAGSGNVDWKNNLFMFKRPSWTAIVEELLGAAWPGDLVTKTAVTENEPRELGPFQLAYIEAVFRAADGRASRGNFLGNSR